MNAIPNNAPTNVAALDQPDPLAGLACHEYGIQWGGPKDVLHIQFQHGARGAEGSKPGIFDDDLLAIIEHRLKGFQEGPYACYENAAALDAVRDARRALGLRVARRMAQGVLGANANHALGTAPEAALKPTPNIPRFDFHQSAQAAVKDAQDIVCPACNAKPLNFCVETGHDFYRDGSGQRWGVHALRVSAAQGAHK
jgi:hypothetical protein